MGETLTICAGKSEERAYGSPKERIIGLLLVIAAQLCAGDRAHNLFKLEEQRLNTCSANVWNQRRKKAHPLQQ